MAFNGNKFLRNWRSSYLRWFGKGNASGNFVALMVSVAADIVGVFDTQIASGIVLANLAPFTGSAVSIAFVDINTLTDNSNLNAFPSGRAINISTNRSLGIDSRLDWLTTTIIVVISSITAGGLTNNGNRFFCDVMTSKRPGKVDAHFVACAVMSVRSTLINIVASESLVRLGWVTVEARPTWAHTTDVVGIDVSNALIVADSVDANLPGSAIIRIFFTFVHVDASLGARNY